MAKTWCLLFDSAEVTGQIVGCRNKNVVKSNFAGKMWSKVQNLWLTVPHFEGNLEAF